MVIGCAYAGKTTLVKKIKGDRNLETKSTSGIEIHAHAFKLNSDESTIIGKNVFFLYFRSAGFKYQTFYLFSFCSIIFLFFFKSGPSKYCIFSSSILSVNRFLDIVFILLSKVSTDEEKEKGCLCLTPTMLDMLDENTKDTLVSDESYVTSTLEMAFISDKASSPTCPTNVTLNSNSDKSINVTDLEDNESDKLINNATPAINVFPENEFLLPTAMPVSENTEQTSVYAVDVFPERSYATLEQNVDLNDCVASVDKNNLKMLSLLDFAGHSAYYACHHIFFSPRAFFILVVDMTKELSSVATEACRTEGLIYSEWTYAGRYSSCARNLHEFVCFNFVYQTVQMQAL